MSKVDFYILGNDAEDEPLRIACRLAEKAWRQGNRVRVQAKNSEAVRRLDTLMWTFKQEGFVAHEVEGENTDWQNLDLAPVILGEADSPLEPPDVLINLSGTVPATAGRCPRIAEIVAHDPASKQAGRDRYRQYRDLGFELDSHQL
jgi:DNA polymerase-3 subunit chi